VQAMLTILRQSSGSSQLREFAGCKTALAIHLKEAFLSVEVA
jgi:hypothetical protein